MKNLIIASLILASNAAYSNSVFSPITDLNQVTAGETYDETQPKVQDPNQFAGKRVAILVSHGVMEVELTYPYHFLKARGAEIDIVAPSWTNGQVVAVSFVRPTVMVSANKTFSQALSENYDLVLITGGAWNSTVLRGDADALRLIKQNFETNKVIAAICSGSQVLIEAGLARGRKLTGTKSVSEDLKNAGAVYLDEPAVTDQNLVTGRGPKDSLAFVQAIEKLL